MKPVFDPDVTDGDLEILKKYAPVMDGLVAQHRKLYPRDSRPPQLPEPSPSDNPVSYFPLMMAPVVITTATAGQIVFAVAGAVGSGLMISTSVIVWRRNRRTLRQEKNHQARWKEISDRVVLPSELTHEVSRKMMERTLSAVLVLESSTSLRRDADLKTQADVALPVHVWEIASGLRDHDRLRAKWVRTVKDGNVTQAMRAQKNILETTHRSIDRRVSSLEKYASQVMEADRQLAELERDEKAVADMDTYLDLAARVARDDRAVAELDGMTEQVKEMRRKVEELMLPLREEAITLFALPDSR